MERPMTAAPPMPSKPRFALGTGALMVGCAVNYFGDRLLGIKLELWRGLLATFSLPSMLDVFVVPFIVGLIVAWIFGRGAYWLCYFPPLIVRCVAYVLLHVSGDIPPGTRLIPFGYWGFFVILAMEAAAIGGVLGEVMIKRTYGRSLPQSPAGKRPGARDTGSR